MKRQFGARGPAGAGGNMADAEAIAVTLFGLIAADPERLGRLLSETGLRPEEMRRAAASPGFLSAVLDHVAAYEERLLELAREAGLRPQDIADARRRLAPPDMPD